MDVNTYGFESSMMYDALRLKKIQCSTTASSCQDPTRKQLFGCMHLIGDHTHTTDIPRDVSVDAT